MPAGLKRSGAPHHVIVEPDTLSKNELRFFISQDLVPLAIPLKRAVEILCN